MTDRINSSRHLLLVATNGAEPGGCLDRLGDAIEQRFDKDVAGAVKAIMQRGEKFGAVSDIVKKLRAFKVEIERVFQNVAARSVVECLAHQRLLGMHAEHEHGDIRIVLQL